MSDLPLTQPICLAPDAVDIRMILHAELPTCPFCEGTPTTFTRFFAHSGIYQSYVHCGRCMAQIFVNARDREEARQKVIDLWRARAGETRDEKLLCSAVRIAVARHSRGWKPRWAAVMDTFAVGSTVAHQLLVRFGFDPDEKVRR